MQLVHSTETRKDFSKVFDWDLFCSGWLEWIDLMVHHPTAMMNVPDRMRWFQQLSNFMASPSAKCRYAKFFHLKYAACSDWAIKFTEDANLLLEHLRPDHTGRADSSGRSSSTRNRNNDQGGGSSTPKPTKKRERTERQPPASAKKTKKTLQLCRSRMDQSVGPCSFGTKCRFSHECPSCIRGGFTSQHTAADCSSFSPAKVAAKVAAIAEARRTE
jgi:hypothetical protein